MKNQISIAILAAIIILSLLIIISLSLAHRTTTTAVIEQEPAIKRVLTPVVSNTKYYPKSIKQIPTLSPDKGLGIDTNSSIVVTSQQEIKKLAPSLPLSRDIATKDGMPVSILITSLDLQNNAYSLYVQIYGVDYNIPSTDAGYQKNKVAFREAAQYALDWMKNQKVDPDKIIIKWGDRKFIQDRAEEWLH